MERSEATMPVATTTRWRARAFAGPADFARMQALQRESWRRVGPLSESHPGDLEWWMYGLSDPDPAISTRICLWESEGGELRGWSWIFRGELEWFVHPDERDLELREQMLDWHAATQAELTPGGDELELSTWSTTIQPELGHELARRGYSDAGHVLVHFTQELRAKADADPAPALPEGYSIRSVAGMTDLPQRLAVQRSAFAPSKMTDERYARVMTAAPTYRPELDICAVAPDGTFAAFVLCWYDEPSRVGLFEPVGTHADHRRLGLAGAVCNEGLHRLRALGAERASVLSNGENEAAVNLYRSLGFVEVMRSVEWTKRIPRQGDPAAVEDPA
jgi:ribosomal protein S18 acetylase RimI-like enzyme